MKQIAYASFLIRAIRGYQNFPSGCSRSSPNDLTSPLFTTEGGTGCWQTQISHARSTLDPRSLE